MTEREEVSGSGTRPRKLLRLDYETAWESNPMDAWVTITLLVVSAVLSVRYLQGYDYEYLVTSWRTMPEHSWTLLSSCLLHGSWMHLGFNLYWTFRFGVLLEAMFGLVPFTLLILHLALVSNATQWAFSGPAIGLSGIGYGLFGLLWALGRWHPRCRGILAPQLAQMFMAWFLLCFYLSWQGILPVANAAHAGGLAAGVLLGWNLSAPDRRVALRTGLHVLAATLLILLVLPPARRLLNRSDAYAEELFYLGVTALEEERWEDATGIYEDLVDRAPELHEAWNNLGVALRNQGELAEAKLSFQRARELEEELVERAED